MVDALNVLEELIKIESVNDPVNGVKPSAECVEYIRSVLSDFGFRSEVFESNGYYSILGYVGYGYPVVMLMAHYDTVPAVLEEWGSNPFTLTHVDGRLYGRGVLDDKGNVAAIIAALSRIKLEKINGTLIYVFTGDEEIGGVNGALAVREVLRSKGLTPSFLINGDGAGLSIIVRRRNVFNVEVTVRGDVDYVRGFEKSIRFNISTPAMNTRHAAYFTPGVDTHPLIAASQYLRMYNTLTASRIKGLFVKSNVVPSWIEIEYVEPNAGSGFVSVDYALTSLIKSIIPMTRAAINPELYSDYGVTVTPNIYTYTDNIHKLVLDVRVMSRDSVRVMDVFSEIVGENIPSASVKVTGGLGYLNTPKNSRIVATASKILKEIGVEPRIVEGAGASDSRFYSPLGIECIDFGLVGGNMHGPNEYVEEESIEKAVKFYTRIVEEILG